MNASWSVLISPVDPGYSRLCSMGGKRESLMLPWIAVLNYLLVSMYNIQYVHSNSLLQSKSYCIPPYQPC